MVFKLSFFIFAFSIEMLKSMLLVAVGGAIGSALRYLVSIFTLKYYVGGFPWHTFSCNLIGAFAMGALTQILLKSNENELIKLFLLTGICGGFTTFSALSIEAVTLIKNGELITALAYVSLTLIFGIGATVLGLFLFK